MPELLVDALISDMDGVLVDTGGIYGRHWELWADQHGIAHERIAAVHFGRPAVETIRLVAPQLDAAAEAKRFNDALADDPDANGVSAMPGAIELVRPIPAHRWAIATSAPRVMAERWLAHIGCPMPDVLVTVDDVERGKPAPDPYLQAAEWLGFAPQRCLVIEDAPAGISAAKAAGAQVLAVLSTHGPADLDGADHLVEGLLDVAASVAADLGETAGRALRDGALRISWRPAAR